MAKTSATGFLFSSVFRHRRLLLEMAKRDISDRYAGQVLGSIWAFIHPVTTVAVFIFIFGVVFRAKADGSLDIPGDHTLYMVSGLVPWLVTADVLGRSSGIISGQASLVKQVVFPIEVLPVKVVLATLPTFLIGFAGLLIYGFAVGRANSALLLYPLGALPLYLFLLGIAFTLSAVGVFLRDVREIIQMYALIGIYIAPIFYFMDWVPPLIRPLIYLNPVTVFMENFHDAAYYGGIRDPLTWIAALILGGSATWFGAMVFSRLKPHFGSYL
ncbi:ABC transporter permease [Rhizobium leguminosarum]|uniref:ABC transporter permease n=1 Tax=Rhizobium leguminosarum TaxID=384 RepID=UPI001C92B0A5|nr:ABC transporter permease [Rhizobium leguminosarum]MBY2909016.1 ABC transporter permease [Rhizobium leguminosarum]MBY2949298.1 ABC transporter permease [Rhizobium leguminosarum]MBY3024382.1 ABC transporter permease [Rhizobium leguminosarum]